MERMITYTPCVQAGFALIWTGVKTIAKSVVKSVVKSNIVHKHPYYFMAAEAVILIVTASVIAGQARTERDAAIKRCYECQQKVDSLQVVDDLPLNKK